MKTYLIVIAILITLGLVAFQQTPPFTVPTGGYRLMVYPDTPLRIELWATRDTDKFQDQDALFQIMDQVMTRGLDAAVYLCEPTIKPLWYICQGPVRPDLNPVLGKQAAR